ncbi:MAG: hypothetical protein M1378_10640 [Bacteroidetes bacterium]|nr:hypothetical protein [Bacteroidota bacterium]
MRIALTLLAVVISTLSLSSCKKGNPTEPQGWDLSGRIIFSVGYSNIYELDLNSSSLTIATLASGYEPRVNTQATAVVYDAPSATGSLDIYAVNLSGGTAILLTNNSVPIEDSWPDWSPDGSSIVFNRVHFPTPYEAIWLMNKDGSGLHALTDTTSLAVAKMPRWSPDGNTIAFIGRVPLYPAGEYEYFLFIISPDGTNQVLLDRADVKMPQWSPDCRYIAYAKSHRYSLTDTVGGVFVVDLTTRLTQRIDIGDVGVIGEGYSWLQNGKLICVAMNPADSTYGIYLASIPSAASSELLATGFIAVPTVGPSPDRELISIFGQKKGDAGLAFYIMRSDGSDCRKFKDIGLVGDITDYCYVQWIK